ncbi:MAG: glycine cleavage system protein H [Acidimicrobiaceae bacterium]|jgi:glycine cleavage system H protein|nr:glycine cleavage system protein H [Acidimicrobiaceae bacterium]HAB58980.1 glycine cleavage system protein GcvH [Acidimicrobiaceae bacterium]
MNVPDGLCYSKDHEWVRVGGDVATVGITDYAQDALGDVVYVDPPMIGSALNAGDSLGEVESTKSVSELYAPISGTVASTNDVLETEPEKLNADPYGDGWICTVTMSDAGELDALMDAETYQTFIAG